jgi:hypothetical protein
LAILLNNLPSRTSIGSGTVMFGHLCSRSGVLRRKESLNRDGLLFKSGRRWHNSSPYNWLAAA